MDASVIADRNSEFCLILCCLDLNNPLVGSSFAPYAKLRFLKMCFRLAEVLYLFIHLLMWNKMPTGNYHRMSEGGKQAGYGTIEIKYKH